MAKLLLVRHGKSEWNILGLWTGQTDVGLTEEGVLEARRAGEFLRDVVIHKAHVSALKRAQQTLAEITQTLEAHHLIPVSHEALNERHYGVYTGKNKWEVKETVGEEEFQRIRRGWDTIIPEGESLKDVHARVVPYYETHIAPDIANGLNVIVVAHGNTLRALIKHLEDISHEDIGEVEVGTGEIYCYDIENGAVICKEVRATNENKKKV